MSDVLWHFSARVCRQIERVVRVAPVHIRRTSNWIFIESRDRRKI